MAPEVLQHFDTGAAATDSLSAKRSPTSPVQVRRPLPLKSLNHVSVHCRDLELSLRFYTDFLGFIPIKRPSSLDHFEGAWLFNYGIGIHLLKKDEEEQDADPRNEHLPRTINPRSNHISFLCDDVDLVEASLKAHGTPYVRQAVEENGIQVHQLFFHDPDCHMIEICNCDVLPVVPIPSKGQVTSAAAATASVGGTTAGSSANNTALNSQWEHHGCTTCNQASPCAVKAFGTGINELENLLHLGKSAEDEVVDSVNGVDVYSATVNGLNAAMMQISCFCAAEYIRRGSLDSSSRPCGLQLQEHRSNTQQLL